MELRQRALRLLARREYSRAELRQRLAPHVQTGDDLEALLNDLQDARLQDDARYAAQRVHARQRRLGDARLREELRQRDIDPALIDTALAELPGELERAHAAWMRQFGGPPTDLREKARQIRFLQRRGFSAETIRRLLRGHFEEA